YAAFTLGAIGPPAAPAVPELTRALGHADATFRAHAAYALMAIKKADPAAVKALRQRLNDEHPEGRLFAGPALWGVEGPGGEGLPTLLKFFAPEQKDGVLRAKAAFALGMLKEQARSAVPVLGEALKDAGNATLRAAAAEALGKIGPAARVIYPGLVELSREEE